MNRFLSLLALSSLAATAASAVPMNFTHQGYLADSSGAALTGTESLTFALYDDASSSSPVWTETLDVTFDGGVYSVNLGETQDIDASLFNGDTLFLGITVGSGAELSQRSVLNSVPYAVRAQDATNVSGGVVDASEIKIGGNTVISADGNVDWSDITGIPGDIGGTDTLSSLSCGAGEVAAFDGAAWACASNTSAHEHTAAEITSGFLSMDRIPVGNGADTVARGNHSHDIADLTGQLSLDHLPDVVKAFFEAGDGTTAAKAGKSCKTILDNTPGKQVDGVYWVDPKEDGAPVQAWCDMTRDGGGWTLIMQNVASVETTGRPTFADSTGRVVVRGGTFGENLAGFDLLFGLSYWEGLGSEGRYEVGSTVGTPTKQAIFESMTVDPDDKYRLKITESTVTIGSGQPGIFSTHNNQPWTTLDQDNDARPPTEPNPNCENIYHHPWFYTNCWSGSIWGSDNIGYTKRAYWTGSATDTHNWGALWIR